jgi:hypothetical protein
MKRQDQVLGFLLQALVLIGNCELGSRLMQALRNRPGNAALIGHPKNDSHSTLEAERHASSNENKEDISAAG